MRLLASARRSYEKDGLSEAAGLLIRSVRALTTRTAAPAAVSEFDRTHGVDTGGIVRIASMDIDSPNYVYAVFYKASKPDEVREAIAALPIRHDEFTFVDFGSGKGLVLLIASLYPFRRVVGVEFAADLNRIASANIAAFRGEGQRCHNVQSVHADAAEWEVPPEPLVCYFYEPFEAPVLSRTLANLVKSCRSTPRPVFLLYHRAHPDSVLYEGSVRNERLILEAGFTRDTAWSYGPYLLFSREAAARREAAATC
jgi:hypothetical protein